MTGQQPSQKRHAALGQALLEDGARESVDLDDHEATLARQRRFAQTEAPDRTVEQTLEEQDQLVERHPRLL